VLARQAAAPAPAEASSAQPAAPAAAAAHATQASAPAADSQLNALALAWAVLKDWLKSLFSAKR
jgi:uncharacterized protein